MFAVIQALFLRDILKSACYISNLRLFLLYGIFKRSMNDG